MDGLKEQTLGYTTKEALVKLRDGISVSIEEHRARNPTG